MSLHPCNIVQLHLCGSYSGLPVRCGLLGSARLEVAEVLGHIFGFSGPRLPKVWILLKRLLGRTCAHSCVFPWPLEWMVRYKQAWLFSELATRGSSCVRLPNSALFQLHFYKR